MVYTTDIEYLKMNHVEREWITNFLHSIPHITFSFKTTNSTFNPEDTDYRESIIFLAILPLVLCVLFMLISCCCTCYQCKKERPQKRVKSCCPGGIVGFVAFLAIIVAALGLYGNEKTEDGVSNFNSAVVDVNDTLTEAFDTINKMHNIAQSLSDRDIQELQNVLDRNIVNGTIKQKISEYTSEMIDKSKKARDDIDSLLSVTPSVNLDFISDNTSNGEFIRSTTTIVVLSVTLFMLFFTLCGCCKKSRCLLSLSITAGFFVLLFTWTMSGIYFGSSVTNADLCVNPDNFIENVVSEQIEKDIIKTYIDCKGDEEAGKYSQEINDALSAITIANDTLTKIWNVSKHLNILPQISGPLIVVRKQLYYGYGNLTALNNVFQCQRTHNNYVKMKDAVCNTVLFNICILFGSFLVLSLMLSWLQCLLPKMWHVSGKRKSGYRPVDDTDPFVPRPPPDYGSLYGLGSSSIMGPTNNSGASMSLTGGPPLDSPPPAYSVRGFGHYRSSSESSTEH